MNIASFIPAFLAGFFLGCILTAVLLLLKQRTKAGDRTKAGNRTKAGGRTQAGLEESLELQEIWKQAAGEVWTSFRSLRHECINTLTAVDYLLKRNRWEEAGQRTASLLEQWKQRPKRGMSFPEVYLDWKQKEAEAHGLLLERESELPAELPFPDGQLLAVLSEVWQVVMESVVSGQEGEGGRNALFWGMSYQKGIFRLQVSYASTQERVPDLTGVIREAEQTGGTADVRRQEDRVEIRVMLYASKLDGEE